MKLRKLAGMVVLVMSMAPGMAFAANAVLSGIFDGTEQKTDSATGHLRRLESAGLPGHR